MLIIIIILSIVFCLEFYSFYSGHLLEDFTKDLYESENIENFIDSNQNTLEDGIDIAKMNIQTFHSFLVMAIAVVALILALYNLLKPELSLIVWSVLILLFLLIGFITIIVIINYRWYKTYIKLMNKKIKTKKQQF